METTEFQARALYDFVAEGPNELNLTANEILTITSTTAGHQWWYAQNSAGQVGAIPANYVEAIYNAPDPTSLSNKYDHTNSEAVNNDSYNQLPSQTNNGAPLEQSYTPSNSYNNWSPTEPVLLPSDQPSQLNEHEITLSRSVDSSSLSAINESSSNTVPVTYTSWDPYIPVTDPSPSLESVPTSVINPLATQNTVPDQLDPFYSNYTQASTDALQSNTQSSYDLISPFGYQQTTTSQQQQNSFVGEFIFPPASTNDSMYDTPSPFSLLPPAMQTTTTQSIPVVTPSSADNLISLPSPVTPTPSKANIENTVTSPAPKPKPDKPKFFTLKRQKTKTEPEKRASLTETISEPSPQSSKDENDSDGFTNSGSIPQNPDLNSNKQPAASGDAKAAPKARFFDKHGIDNYILNGCKAKADEHAEIAYDEKEGGIYWLYNPSTPPFTCKVEDPAKGTKLGGLKSFMEYKIHAQVPGGRVVGRRYKQFDWLHEQLVNKFRFICVPPLPVKQLAGRFEHEFIEERRRQLELWLNRICRHPILCASFPVQHFVTCELTEKNNKDWKEGKRRIEKDELREASWLHCVTFAASNISDTQMATQIDTFAQQQPGLETHLRNLNQGLTKYLERHTEIYERDMQRLGELFSKLYIALQVDTTTTGNKELSNSMSKISSSYNVIGELYKTKSSEGIRDLNERLQEYIGLLSCFPMILSIQRSGAEFIRGVQQRSPLTTPDFSGAIHRSQVLNHVVLAEINFFQKEKVNDFNSYFKTLLNEQIQFYENVTAELRDAVATFN